MPIGKFGLEKTWRSSGTGTFTFNSPDNFTIPYGKNSITVEGKGSPANSGEASNPASYNTPVTGNIATYNPGSPGNASTYNTPTGGNQIYNPPSSYTLYNPPSGGNPNYNPPESVPYYNPITDEPIYSPPVETPVYGPPNYSPIFGYNPPVIIYYTTQAGNATGAYGPPVETGYNIVQTGNGPPVATGSYNPSTPSTVSTYNPATYIPAIDYGDPFMPPDPAEYIPGNPATYNQAVAGNEIYNPGPATYGPGPANYGPGEQLYNSPTDTPVYGPGGVDYNTVTGYNQHAGNLVGYNVTPGGISGYNRTGGNLAGYYQETNVSGYNPYVAGSYAGIAYNPGNPTNTYNPPSPGNVSTYNPSNDGSPATYNTPTPGNIATYNSPGAVAQQGQASSALGITLSGSNVEGQEAPYSPPVKISYYDYPDDNTYPVEVPDGGELIIKID